MHVAWAAATGADSELASQVRFGASREGRGFLVAHMNPFDRAEATKGVAEAVQTIAYNTVDAFDAQARKRLGY